MSVYARNFIVFTLFLALCAGGLAYEFFKGRKEIERGSGWVNHSYSVIAQTYELSTMLEGSLATYRAFQMTGDSGFNNDYQAYKSRISDNIARLSALVKNNPSQVSRLDEARRKFILFSDRLESRAGPPRMTASKGRKVTIDTVNNLKNEIRNINKAIIQEEYMLLNQRISLLEEKKAEYLKTMLSGGVLAIILLALLNAFLLRSQERKGALEKDLSVIKERLSLALSSTRDGIFDWDMQTDEIFWSPDYKQMLGFAPDEISANLDNFNLFVHPDDAEAWWLKLNLSIESKTPEFNHVFRMHHKTGRSVWVHARARLIFAADGTALRFIGAHSDVTALKDAEIQMRQERERAEAASLAKTNFLAHMSHEIRTPLTAISGIAEIFERRQDGLDEKQRKLVTTLNNSTRVLRELITDILDFSKIESGELELEARQFDLAHLFESVVSMMCVKAVQKGIDFALDYQSLRGVTFCGDEQRLRQVFVNLIGNALKFTDKGSVRVTAREEMRGSANWLVVEVTDTGIGIAPEHLEVIFEQFKQADSSVSRRFGGTGLGLPISRNLARLMRGDITVQSELGKGSTFTMSIPAQIVRPEVLSPSGEALSKINDRIKAALTGQSKVLMVEDYEGNILVLGYILDEIGCVYDVARNGKIGVDLWQTHHYDLILMDVQMPEMDGFAATGRIRALEAEQSLPRTPIIGMTAHALIGDKSKCIEAGMDAYLPKPIVEKDLKETILHFLQQKASPESQANRA